jgi:transcriptional repressor NrdR
LRCPYCKIDADRVVDSRQVEGQFSIRRRRECLNCSRRFTTYERIEESVLRVIKKDGRRQAFDRQKILSGLMKACEKRPISQERLDLLSGQIEGNLIVAHEKEVASEKIGEAIMEALKSLDHVAYVRFASVYREFKDVTEFVAELESLD